MGYKQTTRRTVTEDKIHFQTTLTWSLHVWDEKDFLFLYSIAWHFTRRISYWISVHVWFSSVCWQEQSVSHCSIETCYLLCPKRKKQANIFFFWECMTWTRLLHLTFNKKYGWLWQRRCEETYRHPANFSPVLVFSRRSAWFQLNGGIVRARAPCPPSNIITELQSQIITLWPGDINLVS